ncbi:hypothetical protein F1542_13650 [Komagataeibacter sp. FXV3]|nr:hypothetical protein [Komagataeibacter sp. FXV3]
MESLFENQRSFLVKLFSEGFKERHLFEKRRHPKTFPIFYQSYCPGRITVQGRPWFFSVAQACVAVACDSPARRAR